MSRRVKAAVFPIEKQDILPYLADQHILTNDYFKQYIAHAKYESVHDSGEVEAIIVSLAELGFRAPARHDAIGAKALALGYQAAPPHLAFYIRLAMMDQEKSKDSVLSRRSVPDSAITVFSDKIEPDTAFPRAVYIRNVDDQLWIRACRYTDDYEFEPDAEFAFIVQVRALGR